MQLPAECQNPDAVSTEGPAQDWIPGLPKNLIPKSLLPETTFSIPDQLQAACFLAGQGPSRLSPTQKTRCKLKAGQTHILGLSFLIRKALAVC